MPSGATTPAGAGGIYMGCMCKKMLKLLGGLGLILASLGMLPRPFDAWMVLGLMFFLMGLMPMLCKCECCSGGCEMPGKKKK